MNIPEDQGTIKLTPWTEHNGYYIYCPSYQNESFNRNSPLSQTHTRWCQPCTLFSPVLGCQTNPCSTGLRGRGSSGSEHSSPKHHEEQSRAKGLDWAIEVLASFGHAEATSSSSFWYFWNDWNPISVQAYPHKSALWKAPLPYVYIYTQVPPIRYYTIWLQYMWIKILQPPSIFSAKLLFHRVRESKSDTSGWF